MSFLLAYVHNGSTWPQDLLFHVRVYHVCSACSYVLQICLHPMSCYDISYPPCGVTLPPCPEPFAVTSNEIYSAQYPDRIVETELEDGQPCTVTYPGPILTTFPQQTLVGSSALFDMERLLGSRRSFEFEGLLGLGGICGPGSLCNSEPFDDFPYGNCGPV